MVLLDYSKAFDTVWRQRLLLSMAGKGVPIDYVVWINSFLQNRQARVRLHGATSNITKLQRPITSAVPVLHQQSGGTTVQRRPRARGKSGLLSPCR